MQLTLLDLVQWCSNLPDKGCSSVVAGFDLYSVEDVLVHHSTVKIICTDIGFKFPEAILERFIHILALHLDLQMSVGESLDCVSDYRGLVSVIFFNFSNRWIEIEKGHGFAQIVFHKTANHPVWREVENFEDNTQRGEGSFRSTGIKYVCRQEFC